MLEPCDIGSLVICYIKNGERITNVPHRIVRHSPTGFAWGYSGSGPADLALNALSCVIGQEAAEPLYQDFKEIFIAALPKEGGCISVHAIKNWATGAEISVSHCSEIEIKARLEAAEALFAALEELCDEQNGPPLLCREAQWNNAMEKARLAMRAWRATRQQTEKD
jgi:hypothetical protein